MGRMPSLESENRPVNIIAERVNRGLSLNAAAIAMGISRGSLVKAEGGVMPHEPVAKVIADFYEVRVTDIWPQEQAA